MKILNRTGATVSSLFGAAPREDGADPWDISVCSCGSVGLNKRKLFTISRLGVLHTSHSQTLPRGPNSQTVACFSLAPFPAFPLGIHVVWCNKWRALACTRCFMVFWETPSMWVPLMIRYLSACSWALFDGIKFLVPSRSCWVFCRKMMAGRSAPAHLHRAPLWFAVCLVFFCLIAECALYFLLFNPSPPMVTAFLL